MKQYFYLIIIIMITVAGFGVQTLSAQGKSKVKKRKAAKQQVNKQSASGSGGSNSGGGYDCLPPDVKLDTIVSTKEIETASGNKIERESVKQRLDKMSAGCKAGKLIDGATGREIRFYHLQGCWGNPPQDYLEILENQQKELDELKKKYAVVELTCNPSGGLPF
ncbi:MAG TPA: hypothetical protein VK400_07540 [Pyrinomonadaceae bacterium]|nr:hypothetical protein [Pyrinomonadaceae bacterium]